MITRTNFTAFAIGEGNISYPDSVDLFGDTDVVSMPDGNTYLVGSYHGTNLVPQDIGYDEWFDRTQRQMYVADHKETIKQVQAQMLTDLEGQNGELQRKAIEEITTKSSFERYDLLMARKQYVRDYGNEQEEALETMSPEDLMEYRFVVDLEQAGALKSRRITVGAFEGRFTADEHKRIHAARGESEELDRYYNAMVGRTHVWLDYPPVVAGMDALESLGLLDNKPVDPQFSTRREEIARDGDSTEIYRVISYV